MFQNNKKGKKKSREVDALDNRLTECTPQKCFRCGSEDHVIAKFPKPLKDNEKRRKQVRFNERGDCACDNGKDNIDQNIYVSMARKSGNNECPSKSFGDSLQLTNWILDSGATCHMTPEISDFIPGSLKDTNKYIKLLDGHHVTAGKKRQIRIKMCNNNGHPFKTTLHNILLAQELCDMLFSITTLMNSGHTCLSQKGVCTVYFGAKENNAVILPHIAQRKHAFLGKIMERSKKKKLPKRNKIALKLLHQSLGHRSTGSLLAGNTANVWKDRELRIDSDPFCTSCKIYSMKKRLYLKLHSRPKHPSSEFLFT